MAVRWISRTKDQQGLGFAMPSTSGVDGYTVEKKLGRIQNVQPKGTWQMKATVGRLNTNEAEELQSKMDQIAGRETQT